MKFTFVWRSWYSWISTAGESKRIQQSVNQSAKDNCICCRKQINYSHQKHPPPIYSLQHSNTVANFNIIFQSTTWHNWPLLTNYLNKNVERILLSFLRSVFIMPLQCVGVGHKPWTFELYRISCSLIAAVTDTNLFTFKIKLHPNIL